MCVYDDCVCVCVSSSPASFSCRWTVSFQSCVVCYERARRWRRKVCAQQLAQWTQKRRISETEPKISHFICQSAQCRAANGTSEWVSVCLLLPLPFCAISFVRYCSFSFHSAQLQFNANGISGNKIELQHILNIITCSFSHEHSSISATQLHTVRRDDIPAFVLTSFAAIRRQHSCRCTVQDKWATYCHISPCMAAQQKPINWISRKNRGAFSFDLVSVSHARQMKWKSSRRKKYASSD